MESYTLTPELTPAERAALGARGMDLKLAGADPTIVLPVAAEKTALLGEAQSMLDGGGKGLLMLSLGAGIPMGVAAHHVGRNLNRGSDKEEALRQSIRYYTNAGRNIEDRLETPRIDPSEEEEEQVDG